MKGFDVVGFGALNVDRLYRVNRIAGAEDEGFVVDAVEACGGSAANAVVGLARLGCRVGFVGKVAGDADGRRLLKDFRDEGVDAGGVVVAEHGRSGSVMGFVDGEGRRALYVDAGVNDSIGFDEVDLGYVCGARFLHLTSFVGEVAFDAQKRLVEALPESVRVSVDPGALYAGREGVAVEPLIRRAFVVMPNARELELLTGRSDYRVGAEALLRKGVSVVAVKLGSEGCYVTDGRESHLLKALRVRTVDTTGAGDAFCAGFLWGLVSGRGVEECGRAGNFVASRCVTRVGARAGLPGLKDLEAYLAGA
jgi:ribokinase